MPLRRLYVTLDITGVISLDCDDSTEIYLNESIHLVDDTTSPTVSVVKDVGLKLEGRHI